MTHKSFMQICFVSRAFCWSLARQQEEKRKNDFLKNVKTNVWLAYEICSWAESVKKHVILFSVVQFITFIEWLRSLDKGNVSKLCYTPCDCNNQQASLRAWTKKKRKKVNKFSICSSCSFSLLMILQRYSHGE